ncbi:MAG: intradiol ring-cleavage dioxygenase [Candidatus Rokubacteria bacterium]|nr:intradiol ring-cleavage dioxygenase [Candidatus Rokubacteria bacterium]
MTRKSTSRRHFLRVTAAVPGVLALGGALASMARAQPLRPTPACGEGTGPTPRQTAGPFFKPHSPRRTSFLEPGVTGRRIVVSGRVLSTDCKPVPGALVDFWHADDRGEYDNAGYRLRGHQLTDDQGRYRLDTIVPGAYPGRTRHFHVKVQAPNRPVLTTQLYLPGEPSNQRDPIFDKDLVVKLQDGPESKLATFDFVLDLTGRVRSGRQIFPLRQVRGHRSDTHRGGQGIA